MYFTGLTNQYFPAYSGTILKQPLFEFSGNQHTCIYLGFLREAMNRNCQSSLKAKKSTIDVDYRNKS